MLDEGTAINLASSLHYAIACSDCSLVSVADYLFIIL